LIAAAILSDDRVMPRGSREGREKRVMSRCLI
jgi:hypothetical protein